MTRTVTLLMVACCLALGAAAASIVAGDSLPWLESPKEMRSTPSPQQALQEPSQEPPQEPIANRERKTDRLEVAALPPPDPAPPNGMAQPSSEPLRRAFASDSPVTLPGGAGAITAPVTIPPSTPPQKPKLVAKPPVQKAYTLLSDAQIAGIKDRLKLTPDQESYWPGVEAALRAIARKIHDKRQSRPAAGSPPIDPESEEVAQLKSAAMPLLFQLREDQKREVRALARIIGLEAVASRI